MTANDDSLKPPRTWRQSTQNLRQSRRLRPVFALLTAAALSALLWQCLPLIQHFWQLSLQTFLPALLPDGAHISREAFSAALPGTLSLPIIDMPLNAPSLSQLGLLLTITALLFLACGRLSRPFRGAFRCLLSGHGLFVLAAYALAPAPLYTLAEHTRHLSRFSLGLLLLTPLIMAAIHSIIERSVERRLLASTLIALWLIIALPFKLLVHALLIHVSNGLLMPSLFLIAGPALDVFIFSALYVWALSWPEKTA